MGARTAPGEDRAAAIPRNIAWPSTAGHSPAAPENQVPTGICPSDYLPIRRDPEIRKGGFPPLYNPVGDGAVWVCLLAFAEQASRCLAGPVVTLRTVAAILASPRYPVPARGDSWPGGGSNETGAMAGDFPRWAAICRAIRMIVKE
jgi:hypothetical protein